MPTVNHYQRPATVADALRLLAEPGAVPLAGGTQLVAAGRTADTVVDLQDVGLDGLTAGDGTLTLGAMVRLQTLADHDAVPPLIRAMARREGPNTIRAMGTLGGAVAAADPESELLAALLVHNAVVTVQSARGGANHRLADGYRPAPGELITAVTVRTGGATAAERVARTPADAPIVAVVGRRDADGRVTLAACGVADRPIILDEATALTPPDDFRGSAEYRRTMVDVLRRRVLSELGQ